MFCEINTMGKCKGYCGKELIGEGYCHSCGTQITQMAMVNDLNEKVTDMHYGVYHDNGCCGCTKNRRRFFFFILALIFFVSAFIFLVKDENRPLLAFGCLLVWFAFFLMVALLCPNGCCGMYAADKSWGVISSEDISTCFGCCEESEVITI